MNISYAKVRITEEDIMSIIDEEIKIDGLKVSKFSIDNEFVTIEGTYTKGIKLPFKAVVGIEKVEEDKLIVRIFRIKALGVRLSVKFVTFILKGILKDLLEVGINVDSKRLIIDFKKLQKVIPIIDFKLKTAEFFKSYLEVEVESIKIKINKETKTLGEIKKEEHKKLIESRVIVDDIYTKIRKSVENNIPEKYKEVTKYLIFIPDFFALIFRILKDKRVSIKIKAMLIASLVYFISPIDLINDIIPVVGSFDDIYLLFYALNMIIEEVPENVIIDNWSGDCDVILLLREGVKTVFDTIGLEMSSNILSGFRGKILKRKINKKKKLK